MTQTKEERFEYWRKRMLDKLHSMSGQFTLDIVDIVANAKHSNMDDTEITKNVLVIAKAYDDLAVAVKEAKEKGEKHEEIVEPAVPVSPENK
jgi:hypothetical protein